MKRIIILTDFSASSRNAIYYTTNFMRGVEYSLTLLHVFTANIGLAGDGTALASLKDAFSTAEDEMADQITNLSIELPSTKIMGKIATGSTLEEAIAESILNEKPDLFITGGISDYSDLWAIGPNLLDMLIHISIPVLIIPKHVIYNGLKNIGYACDYRICCTPAQASFIKWLVAHTSAQLHIVHVTRDHHGSEQVRLKNETMLREAIKEVHPLYYTIESPAIIDSLVKFITSHELDMLIVMPRKHDLWYSIFHKSNTKELARLNNIPILSLYN